jgi:hypothetical protein
MTIVKEKIESIREVAEKLAEDNVQASPELEAIYLFPAKDTVRLVLIDPVTIPSEQMVPFYFGAFPQGGVPYASAIALIRPEEKFTLPPPVDWGGWENAVQLWPKKEKIGKE